ncbi:MAG: hypothetical protein RIR49_1034 [Actinomycetota bacterium]|jgi:hypothetical protein
MATPIVTDSPTPTGPGRTLRRITALLGAVVFVGFWTWALFFASKEAINQVGDRRWAADAEAICAAADAERLELADYRLLNEGGPELIRERADIVDRATDILERMIGDVARLTPADEKGQAIVPMWIGEYRTYIADRRNYAEQLRLTGENLSFYETMAEVPISERLETFAGDNEMTSCAPPRDLTM